MLKCCFLFRLSSEVKDADEVRTLIKDIWDVRAAKLRKSVNKMINHDGGGGKPLAHVEVMSYCRYRLSGRHLVINVIL